jgi:hypothetical protein
MRSWMMRLLCGAMLAAAVDPVLAQSNQAVATPQNGEQKIDVVTLTVLIKSSIMALEHANTTGNYSVLRDLGTPAFREKFDQARIAAVFANLRSRHITLNPVLLLSPNLTKQPEVTPQNQLHLVGTFPTKPSQIQFELWFLKINDGWRIEGISVDAIPVQATHGGQAPAKASPSAALEALRKANEPDRKTQRRPN